MNFQIIGSLFFSFCVICNAYAESNPGKNYQTATFAGGCFWSMQLPFDELKGVISTTVGYTGGTKENPTYDEVSSGKTGHAESIEVVFDPKIVSYQELLNVFWHQINPTTLNRQFGDEGPQYRTAIFYHNDEQKRLAEISRDELNKSGRYGASIVTEITSATPFYPAEEYHQQYYKKSPLPYKYYRFASGRDRHIEKIWGKSEH